MTKAAENSTPENSGRSGGVANMREEILRQKHSCPVEICKFLVFHQPCRVSFYTQEILRKCGNVITLYMGSVLFGLQYGCLISHIIFPSVLSCGLIFLFTDFYTCTLYICIPRQLGLDPWGEISKLLKSHLKGTVQQKIRGSIVVSIDSSLFNKLNRTSFTLFC